MNIVSYRVPRKVLVDDSHAEEQMIIYELFKEFDQSEDWLTKTAACVASFLSGRSSYGQAAELLNEAESVITVLIGGSGDSRQVRIKCRSSTWHGVHLELTVTEGVEKGLIKFGSSSNEKIIATDAVLEGFDAELVSVRQVHGSSPNSESFIRDLREKAGKQKEAAPQYR